MRLQILKLALLGFSLVYISNCGGVEERVDYSDTKFQVYFDLNGGEGVKPDVIDKFFETSITLPSIDGFTRTGYTPLGWNTYPSSSTILNSYSIPNKISTLYLVWKANKYLLNFDANGGNGSLDSRSLTYNSYINFPAITGFSKTGFNALGWHTDPQAVEPLKRYQIPNNDSTLYIIWSTTQYTLNYDANGGTGSLPSQTFALSANVILPSIDGFTREGHTALGWNTTVDATEILTSFTMPNYNVVLYTVWQVNSYTVSFDNNGGSGSLDSQSVLYNSSFNLPYISGFTKPGYTAIGWNTDPDAVTSLNSYTIPAADTILYILWQIASYQVNFDANGGTGSLDSQTAVYDTEFTLPTTTSFSRQGYTAIGWHTNLSSTEALSNYAIPANNSTLYVVWQPNAYSISFDNNNGIGIRDSETVEYGSDFTLPSTTGFTKEGYTAIGWNDDKDAVEALDSYTVPDYDSVLYIIWEIKIVTISFSANGGSGDLISQTATYGTDFSFPSTSGFTRDNYTAIGWNINPSAIITLTKYTVTENDVTLYVIWEVNEEDDYIVSFDANGGSGSLSSQEAPAGSNLPLPPTTNFGRLGYSSLGWNTDSSVSNVISVYTVPNYNSILYVIWETNYYVINFDANGGSGNLASQSAEFGSSVVLPPTTGFTRSGYSILGWNDNQNASNAISSYIVPGSDSTLYIVWKANDYIINFDANSGSGSLFSQTAEFNSDFPLPATDSFTKEGYTALGWNNDATATVALTNYTVPASDSTLYVIWKINDYIINFDANSGNGSIPSQTAEFNSDFPIPATDSFTKEGYTALGWNSDATATAALTSYTVPASDSTLYVIWQINSYTISFDANSGSGSIPSQTAEFNSDFPLPATDSFTKEGYTALGWNSDASAADALTSYTVPASDSTLYIIWKINDYTINFDANSGSGSIPSQTAEFNSDFPLPATDSFTKEGYTALGWNIDSNATTALTSYTVPASDSTLSVIWKINDYTINFDANSGSGSIPSQTAEFNSDFPLPTTDSFTKEGYTALGWNSDASAADALTSYTVPASDSTLYVIWQINSYTISFDANSGSGSIPNQTAEFNSDFPLPETTSFTKEGYRALGWNSDASAVAALTSYTVPASDSTLYIIWKINDYTINFDANSGSGLIPSQTAEFNSDFSLPATTDFTKEGYTALGWNSDSNATTALTSYTVPASDSTLYVIWQINSYTISFDANSGSGSIPSQTAEFNSDFPLPATTDFTKEGYTALGWNNDASAADALTSYTVPANDSTLYVIWQINNYTISFDANSGSGSIPSQTAEFNSDFPLPETTSFTKEGYTALGWNIDSNATTALTSYTVPASDSTLYVIWKINDYTINFDANSGSGSIPSQTAEFNSDFPIPATDSFTKEGYTALGWNSDATATAALTSYTVPANDSTLYVIWQINSYTISFDANSGSGSIPSQTAEFNSDFPLPATDSFTKEGYTALGWNSDSNATTALTSYTLPASDITLYIIWKINGYTINFDANSGSGSIPIQTAEFNSDFPLPATTDFTKEGYTALGWNSDASAVAALTSYTVPASDSTLYVIWQINSYTISFDANSGSGSIPIQTAEFNSDFPLPATTDFTKEGYTALGWNNDASAADALTSYTVPASDSTLYVIWQINSYTISFDANSGSGSIPNQTAEFNSDFPLPETTSFTKEGYRALGWNSDASAVAALTSYTVPASDSTLYIIWKINDYTINFDANSGSGSIPSQTAEFNSDFSLPATTDFTKEGYTALGWNSDSNATTALTSYTVPASDSTLYVIWQINSYTISFDANSGSGSIPSQTAEFNSDFPLPATTDFTKEGYTALGWNNDASAADALTSYTVPANDSTLYVIWQINNYTISFDANSGSGSIPSQTAEFNSDFPLPETTSFTKEGYTALGWNIDSNATTALTSYTVPASDSTLYVIWKINDYTINFDANSGSGSIPSQTAEFNSDFPLPSTDDFGYLGYDALGWNNDASAVAALTSYTVPANDSTLYVIWQINSYTISFDANSGSGSIPSQTAEFNSDFPLPATDSFTKEGYTSLGWNSDASAADALTSYTVPASDSTLYIIWKINDYTINFDANSGSGSIPSQTAEFNSDFPLPATDSFTKEGYTALGWNSDSNATTALTSYTVPASDSTLSVIWKINDYTINFDANSGSGSIPSQTAEFNSDFPLPETTSFTKEGYTALGWNSDASAVAALTSYTVPASDSTLYVIWQINSYTISFDANSGSGSIPNQTAEFNSDFPLPETTSFTKEGYTALGWNNDASAADALTSYTVPANDSTLYVIWQINNYTISFDANSGNGSIPSQTAEFNSDFPIPATDSFTKEGYTALGWNSDATATAALTSYTVPASDSTLYVIWQINSYTISFDANSGSGSIPSQTAEFNSDFPLPATDSFTKEGYTALGWNSDASSADALTSYTVPASDSTLYIIWKINDYTINFDANSGSGSIPSQTAEFNSDFPLPATDSFTKEGYTALGWNSDASAVAALTSYTVPASDSTLYVIWKINDYTINFDANSGSGSIPSQTAEFNSDFPLPSTDDFGYLGYDALGWNNDASAATALTSYTVPASDSTLYVIWQINSYTISFDANSGSGSIPSQTAEFNSDFPLPATDSFTKEGYTALGWNSDVSATAALTSYTVPASDSTLYVIWKINGYTINFDANSGSGSIPSQTAEFNSDFPLPATTDFTKEGYTALGWNSDASAVAALTSYTVPASDSTLYVIWQINSYTISFDANSGSGSIPSQTAEFNSDFPLPATTDFTKEGYTALGWNSDASAVAALTNYTVPASDSTLYVIWQINSYTINFDANNGSGSIPSQTAEFNSDFPLPITDSFTKEGYTALGWNSDSNATTALTSYTVPASDSTLYVIWQINSYTINFDANGGNGGLVSQTATYNTDFPLPSTNSFDYLGYDAIGWNSDASAAAALTSYTVPASDSTLYVIWEPATYTINFDANSGNGSLASQTASYLSDFTFPGTTNFTKEGYTALGWNSDASAADALTSYTVPANDSTLYVIWQINNYTISFDANSGSGSIPSQTAEFNSDFPLPATTDFTKEGYTALGWNSDASATAALTSYTIPASDSTLYIIWQINSYTINFDANGGSGLLTSQIVNYNIDFPFPSTDIFGYLGYDAIGWNNDSSATVALISYTVPASDSTLYVIWAPKTYTISFNNNGGVGSLVSQTAEFNSDLPLPATTGFAKTGYTALGWNSDSSATTALTSYIVPAIDSVLYVVWEPAIYNINFDANTGIGSLASQTAPYLSSFAFPGTTNFIKTGYAAVGWNSDASATAALTSYTVPASDSTLYVIWQISNYTISFDANGGNGGLVSQTATYNTDFPFPSTSSFDYLGYDAIGWNSDASATVALTSYTVPASDSILYVIWEPATYTINFDANSGNGSLASQTASYLSDFTFPGTTNFTKEGYTALGWNSDSSATTALISYTVPSSDSTLYIIWELATYNISFDANGGSGVLASQTAVYLSDFPLPTTTDFTKEGYTALGWNSDASATEALTSYTVPASDSTLYVVWQLNSYTISFDANGGSGVLASQTDIFGSNFALPSTSSFGYLGHTAIGWNDNSSATVALTSYTVPSSDSTLYVVWQINSYTISFDANSGNGVLASQTAEFNSDFTLPDLTSFTKEGYVALGWNSDASAATALTSYTVPASDSTLYVIWEPAVYNISFDANGGSGVLASQTSTFNTIFSLPSISGFSRSGYSPIGWNSDPNANVVLTNYTVPSSDSTLYVIWHVNSYTVDFDINGGIGSAGSITANYDEIITLPSVSGFYKTAYSAIGWSTDPNATVGVTSYSVPIGGSTLYVVWQEETIDIDGDGLIEIKTADELNYVRYNLAGSSLKTSITDIGITRGCPNNVCVGYELYNDIDLLGTSYETNWEPIGGIFTGIFDGNTKTISNLTINSDASYVGLFSKISGTIVRNLNFDYVSINNTLVGNVFLGTLAGQIETTNLLNININSMNITSVGNYVGGLVGSVLDMQGIDDVHIISGTIAAESYVGGLFGNFSIPMPPSATAGAGYDKSLTNISSGNGLTITSNSGLYLGGLIGYIYTPEPDGTAQIDVNSNTRVAKVNYSQPIINNSSQLGSFIGSNPQKLEIYHPLYNKILNNNIRLAGTPAPAPAPVPVPDPIPAQKGKAIISDSYSQAKLSGANNVGGLVGFTRANLEIYNSYFTGTVDGPSDTNIGGLIGYAQSPLVLRIQSSYSRARVGILTAPQAVGGLIGQIDIGTDDDSSVTITSSYDANQFEALSNVCGNLIGKNNLTVNNYTISNSAYATYLGCNNLDGSTTNVSLKTNVTAYSVEFNDTIASTVLGASYLYTTNEWPKVYKKDSVSILVPGQ